MRRIQIDATDVHVLGNRQQPPQTGIGALLRRIRVRVGLGIAAVELIAFLIHKPSALLLGLIAALLIVIHFNVARRGLPYTLRQVTWIAAFSQSIVALFPVLFALTTIAVVVMVVGFVLIGLMLVLGDRA